MHKNPSERLAQTPKPSSSTDLSLETLLRSLPREGAALGFEERVLRRVRAQPKPPLTVAASFRLAAPLVVAAALGFVFGPGLLERSSGTSSRSKPSASGALEMAATSPGGGSIDQVPLAPPLVAMPRGGTIPSVGSVVGMSRPNPAPTSLAGGLARSSNRQLRNLAQIRAEAERVRSQLEDLRRVRAAASATITLVSEEGVEVQVDLRELLAALEQQAAEAAAAEGVVGDAPHSTGLADDPESSEPPLW